jgi:hypothetical protein
VTLVQPSPIASALLVLGLVWIIWPLRRNPAQRAGDLLEPAS